MVFRQKDRKVQLSEVHGRFKAAVREIHTKENG
jgi:hypothetical protein